VYLKERGMRPRQVQDFIPTPMAVATTMFYTGIDPLSNQPVYTATDLREKRMMKALLFYWDEAHHALAREALVKAGRADLIGAGPHALVPHEKRRGSGTSPMSMPRHTPVRPERKSLARTQSAGRPR
jgi:hypothetical protein